MTFPAYPAYKDSGVEWLGEVPQHWPVYSLKRTVDGCVNGLWGDEPDGENDIAVIRVADFKRSFSTVGLDKLTYRSITPKERQSRQIKSGDLLIEKSGGGEKTLVGCVVLFTHEFDAITSNFVARMRPLAEFDSQFLCYAFGNLYHGRVNYPSVKQVTGIQNLDAESYLQERFCFPPRAEQTQIALFLDHETARIDTLIEEQQRLIELLKEKRQAVISHAVTKGLDPMVPMKDSGVEWLGKVPAHWDVVPTNYRYEIQLGRMLNEQRAQGDHLKPYLRVFDVQWNAINTSNLPLMDFPPEVQPMYRLKIGDLMVNEGGSYVGRSAIWRGDLDECYYQKALHRLRPRDMKSDTTEFFLHVMEMATQRGVFVAGGNQTTIDHLTAEQLRQYRFAFPPFDEQLHIAEKITEWVSKIQNTTSEAEQLISYLQERRSALISAAVTGKIDVRGWQPPASALSPELAQEAV